MERSNVPLDSRSIQGTDFLQLDRSAAPAVGLADWLTSQLRAAVADGRLPVGSTLPASRVLASELGVSRGVVTEAYRRLAEDGLVAGRGRAGTAVVAVPTVIGSTVIGPTEIGPTVSAAGLALQRRAPIPPADGSWHLDGGASRDGAARNGAGHHGASQLGVIEVPGTEVFDALRAVSCRIDLSPGVPDLAAFPRSAWLRAERTVLGNLAPASFGYGDPRGAPAFRVAVAHWLARNRGIRAAPEDVIVTAGVAQALALLARSLRHVGLSAVAVEDPGSLGARQQLQSWGLATPPVAVDDQGIRVSELRACAAAAVMITPAHEFPMGVVLDGARRRELRQWAMEGGLVIEDDYDAEHRYDRPPVPALRAALAEQVCYAGSVSKLLAPALRVGWLLVPSALRETVVAAKRDSDLGNAVLPQLVLAELMTSGDLERHHRLLRKLHVRRRDAMIDAVRAHLPQARLHGAAAGLHLTLTFDGEDQGLPDTSLAAAALERGVKMHPLSWHRQRPGPPGLVLGYAASTPTQIADGIATVASVMRSARR